MFKKIALFGAAACFAVTTAASAAGAYVGIGLGYQDLHNKMTGTDTDTTLGVTTTNTATITQAGDGVLGQIYAGYGLCLGNNFWAALELNGELGSTKISTSHASTANGLTQTQTATTKLKGGYGISFRPGYFTSEQTKVYGVLGWQRGKFQNTATEQDSNSATVNSLSASKWLNGFRYGVGLETNLTGQLGLRAEVTQTRYKSQDLSSTSLEASVSNKPTASDATLSLVWTIGDFAGIGGAAS